MKLHWYCFGVLPICFQWTWPVHPLWRLPSLLSVLWPILSVNVQWLVMRLWLIILHAFGCLPHSHQCLASALHWEALATVPSLTLISFALIWLAVPFEMQALSQNWSREQLVRYVRCNLPHQLGQSLLLSRPSSLFSLSQHSFLSPYLRPSSWIS